MIKFFRKIRQRLLTENKFSKYLIYAIGEIILVVIGILIALSINNWNEQNKIESQESKLLTEIKIALKGDLKVMNANIRSSNKSLESIQIINEQILLDQPTNDSIGYHFSYFLQWTTSDITTGPYENLKSKGFELISSDELRNKIIYFYEQTAKFYIDQNYYLSNNYYLEYCTKLFNSVAFLSDMEINEIVPNDFKSLKEDRQFNSLLNTRLEEHNFKKYNLKFAIEDVLNLIALIDVELAKN